MGARPSRHYEQTSIDCRRHYAVNSTARLMAVITHLRLFSKFIPQGTNPNCISEYCLSSLSAIILRHPWHHTLRLRFKSFVGGAFGSRVSPAPKILGIRTKQHLFRGSMMGDCWLNLPVVDVSSKFVNHQPKLFHQCLALMN